MKKQQFISILDRYLKNQATAEEQNLLHAYYHLFMADDDVLLLLRDEEKEKLKLQIKAGINARLGKIETDVAAEPLRRIRLWPRIAVAAAAVAAIVFGVWFFNPSPVILNSVQDPALASNDIAPGKNGATITLANGKVIQLSDAKTGVIIGSELKYSDGTAVEGNLSPSGRDGVAREGNGSNNTSQPSLPDGHLSQGERGAKGGQRSMMLTASTAKGQTYQFTLPDGTKVWLNADSKISFPSQFIGKERKILLDGEAYFEVSKLTHLSPPGRTELASSTRQKNNKNDELNGRRPERVPFIVQTETQTVEVLGTHFNINAYKDESNTKTTLLEGSVRVGPLPTFSRDGAARGGNGPATLSPRKGDLPTSRDKLSRGERGTPPQSLILKPNQQSVISGSNRITVKQVDVNESIGWKDGDFVFRNDDFKTLMRKVARWYNVEIIYDKSAPSDLSLLGEISRSKNISAILNIMEATGDVHFKIEGRRVIVTK